jgi:hypothetical protein
MVKLDLRHAYLGRRHGGEFLVVSMTTTKLFRSCQVLGGPPDLGIFPPDCPQSAHFDSGYANNDADDAEAETGERRVQEDGAVDDSSGR